MSESWHNVPNHVGRVGQVVVGQVQGAKGGHVGQGRGRDEGQLVGGHVEMDEVGKMKAGEDGQRGVGHIQMFQAVLEPCESSLMSVWWS